MSVKNKIKTIGWLALGLCCVVLLVAAMKAKDSKACNDIEINMESAAQHMFIKEADVIAVLSKNNISAGKTLDDINLKKAEGLLKNNAWIKDAELFFDNHQVLHVNIQQREPIARVFTINGNSFYIDSSGLRLPVNENASARVIVFTSFPSDKKALSKPDSLVLNDVKKVSQYITADSFFNEQTAQINITPQRTYEITPVVGNQVIKIGNADSLDKKFSKLLAFYKQVFSKVGFEKYSVIDVQYEAQIVAVKRGESHSISDTTRAVMQLAKADAKLKKVLNDTMYAALLSNPVVLDEEGVDKKTSGEENNSERKKTKAVMKKKG